MAFIGGIIPTGPAGAGGPERSIRKKREELRKGDDLGAARRDADEAEIRAAEDLRAAEHARAVRENDSEESREEHAGHSVYGPGGRAQRATDRPRLDLEG